MAPRWQLRGTAAWSGVFVENPSTFMEITPAVHACAAPRLQGGAACWSCPATAHQTRFFPMQRCPCNQIFCEKINKRTGSAACMQCMQGESSACIFIQKKMVTSIFFGKD